jgi:phage shock protein PspC (stress-responsive transcriptional regulator)
MRDLGRMRRSRTDRYLGGVAGGLARHLDIDPTVVRVLFVVTSFFGGAGVLAYLALWLLVPDESSDHASIQLRGDTRRTVIVVVGAVAVLVLLGNAWGGNWGFWRFSWLVVVLGVIALLLANRDHRPDRRQAPAPPQGGSAPQPTPYDAPAATATADAGEPLGPQPPAPWQPPAPPPPAPRPRRTGLVWFWPTLALIAIGLGILAVVGSNQDLPAGSYPALALGIIGGVLVVGAFLGRAGGLIALGIVTAIALAVSTAVGQVGVDWHSQDMHRAPTTAAAVQPSYHVDTGSIYLDLSRVSDPQALDGRLVEVSTNAGQIHVIVPDGMDVQVNADIKFAGDIEVAGDNRNGTNPSLQTSLDGGENVPQLTLDLHERVGQIVVDREGVLR